MYFASDSDKPALVAPGNPRFSYWISRILDYVGTEGMRKLLTRTTNWPSDSRCHRLACRFRRPMIFEQADASCRKNTGAVEIGIHNGEACSIFEAQSPARTVCLYRTLISRQIKRLVTVLVSIARYKPTAFEAVSFERFSTRMREWASIDIAGTRCAISNITWCGSRSTVIGFCAAT